MSIEKQDIKREAKQIMDKFIEQLDGVEVEENFKIDRDNFLREESEVEKQVDLEFKQMFLDNAPNKNSDFVVTKRGDWV